MRPLLVGLLALASCATPPISSDTAAPPDKLKAFAAQVHTYLLHLDTAIKQDGAKAIDIGKAACASASGLNGLFQAVASVGSAISPAVAASEAGVFGVVQVSCGVIDSMPSASAVVLAPHVSSVLSANKVMQDNLTAVAPAVAAVVKTGG